MEGDGGSKHSKESNDENEVSEPRTSYCTFEEMWEYSTHDFPTISIILDVTSRTFALFSSKCSRLFVCDRTFMSDVYQVHDHLMTRLMTRFMTGFIARVASK